MPFLFLSFHVELREGRWKFFDHVELPCVVVLSSCFCRTYVAARGDVFFLFGVRVIARNERIKRTEGIWADVGPHAASSLLHFSLLLSDETATYAD